MRASLISACRNPVRVGHCCYIVAPVSSRSVSCEAKKGKKKGGKKGNKKGGGLLADVPKLQPWQKTEVIMQHLLMIESYRRASGKPLIENAEIEKIADVIFHAPFACLSHNRFAPNVPDDKGIYTFANQAGLDAFQAESFDDLVGLKSTVVIEGLDGEDSDREALLSSIVPGGASESEAAAQPEEEEGDDSEVEGDDRKVPNSDMDMSVAKFTCKRVGLKGRIIEIIDGNLWNIVSPTGTIVGQAVWFDTYALEDGTVVKCGAGPEEEVAEASPEALAEAEAAVEEQGAAVRGLKEQDGMTNKSPEVQEAVEELLRRKERLQALQAAVPAQQEEASA